MSRIAYLTQKYQLKWNHIELPGHSLQIISVADIEILLEEVNHEDDLPFWASLWPAARGLAAFLWADQHIAGIKALELGAGTGLPGIVAALRGAHVVQTDFIPDALVFCQENAALNGAETIRQVLADWRTFQVPGRFPLIFGSDILYEPALHVNLVEIMDKKLAPGGRILIADPGRKTVMQFLQLAEAAGFAWDVEEIFIPGEPALHHVRGNKPTAIDILKLSRLE
ncbi:MAG: methyltransferase domain-containing protein [Firmicutes bacterium]|nr:methyltransferase domain-containing protein [Bacillota bacterium]